MEFNNDLYEYNMLNHDLMLNHDSTEEHDFDELDDFYGVVDDFYDSDYEYYHRDGINWSNEYNDDD